MTVTELLEKIREYYLTKFIQEITEQKEKGLEIINEPEFIDEFGELITEGVLATPYRNDLIVLKDNHPIKSILIDTGSKFDFEPISLQWSDSLLISITPFQWNYLTVDFGIDKILDWTPLKNWFFNSFHPKSKDGHFKEAVHYISDPYTENKKILVDIDLGSGTINDFEGLLDTFDKMDLEKVTLK